MEDLLNKKVVVTDGVAFFFGKLAGVNKDVCKLKEARKVVCPDSTITLKKIAARGVKIATLSCEINEIDITGVAQIIPLKRKAEVNLLTLLPLTYNN